nr:hypothetical protein [Dinophyceae sp. MRD-151]
MSHLEFGKYFESVHTEFLSESYNDSIASQISGQKRSNILDDFEDTKVEYCLLLLSSKKIVFLGY